MNNLSQTVSEQTLEATVARLVAEALRACGADLTKCKPLPATKIVTPSVPQKTSAPLAALTIEDKVISLKTVESLPKLEPIITVRSSAVITPAAEDYLKQKKVTIQRAGLDAVSPRNASDSVSVPTDGIRICDNEMPGRAEAIKRQLSLRGLQVACENFEDLARSISSDSGLGIVVSSLPTIEIDLLSRVHNLRVAAADSIESVRRLRGRFTPQAWVLDSQRLTLSGLVSVADACIRQQASGSGNQTGGSIR